MKDVIIVLIGIPEDNLRNNSMKKRELKKLPESIDLQKAEEIFSDRLAELIVMTLDYQYDQKLKAKTKQKEDTPSVKEKSLD